MKHKIMILFLVLSLLNGCGSSSGGSDPVSHAPLISNLIFNPQSARVNDGGGIIRVETEFKYSDIDGDVKIYSIKMTLDGIDIYKNGEVSDVENSQDGHISGYFDMLTTSPSNLSYEVYLTDSEGNDSNTLMGTFLVL